MLTIIKDNGASLGFEQKNLDKENEEFIKTIKKYDFLRNQRVNYYQGIYISLLVAAIVLFVDLIAKTDIVLKIILIIFLIAIAELVYRKSVIQAQKPVFVCENAVGTLEKRIDFKDENGKEWATCKISDLVKFNK